MYQTPFSGIFPFTRLLAASAILALGAGMAQAQTAAAPTPPITDRSGPLNGCERLTGEARTRCDQEHGGGQTSRQVDPVGNSPTPPTSGSGMPRRY